MANKFQLLLADRLGWCTCSRDETDKRRCPFGWIKTGLFDNPNNKIGLSCFDNGVCFLGGSRKGHETSK